MTLCQRADSGPCTSCYLCPRAILFLDALQFVTVAWSIFLSRFWKVGPISTALFTGFGIHVGLRCYCWRTVEADRKYLIFNIQCTYSHGSPRLARPETSFLTHGRPRFGTWLRMYFLCMLGRPDDDVNRFISTKPRYAIYCVISCAPGAGAHDLVFMVDRFSIT